ncbi:energy-coupling factor ABC transporter substrate-binding protein [Methanobacterium sp.]|uniref:energy-coupling factor ABC transporter substrate-binding protein n=1 Tax=Methanobacterium sp. TaxID=2164 RepID=UPI003158D4A0
MVDKKPVALLLLAVVIVAVPFALYNGKGEDQGYFTGSDDQGSQAIEATGYQPWFSSIWEPPSGEIESLLFAVQAAIGALIIGYVLGYYKGRAKTRKEELDKQLAANEQDKVELNKNK